jgi:nitroreductase
MNEIIRKRKSIRKYEAAPLDTATLEWIQEQIAAVKPLYPNIRYNIEIASKTKGLFNVKAPHYLIFSSEEGEGFCENIGFIGQQLDLALSGNGIGTCWLGGSKPSENEKTKLTYVIAMAFGTPNEPLYRSLDEFKRKPLSAISTGEDVRLEAARLAPSAVNSQNWFFAADNGKIHCYRKKLNPIVGLIYNRLNRIDMGIAIYHIAAESKDLEQFEFAKSKIAPERKGYVYTGTVLCP